jgi:hypothetical protein
LLAVQYSTVQCSAVGGAPAKYWSSSIPSSAQYRKTLASISTTPFPTLQGLHRRTYCKMEIAAVYPDARWLRRRVLKRTSGALASSCYIRRPPHTSEGSEPKDTQNTFERRPGVPVETNEPDRGTRTVLRAAVDSSSEFLLQSRFAKAILPIHRLDYAV